MENMQEDISTLKTDLKEGLKDVNVRIDNLEGKMEKRFEKIENRLERMEGDFHKIDLRVNTLEQRKP
jgi:hypothetical protein